MRDQRPDPDQPASLTRPLTLARLALGWERLSLALWPAALIGGGFLTLAFADLLPALPGWLHGLILAATLAALTATATRGLRSFRWPSEAESARRLERDNALVHRPLLTLSDCPATTTDDPTTAALWRAHQRAMARRTHGLSVRWPRADLAQRDPLALRALVGLALFATAVGSWGDWSGRLKAALLPRLTATTTSAPVAFDIWLTPPVHTGIPPIFLHRASASTSPTPLEPEAGAADTPIAVPTDSLVLARVSGGDALPVLTINESAQGFAPVDGDHFQIQENVRGGSVIAITQGERTLGRWAITVVPATPPTIGFAAPPTAVGQGALRLDYQAADDYGITGVTLTVRPVPGAADAPEITDSEPLILPLALPALNQKRLRGTSLQDLAASPWAGHPARLVLTATDSGGRSGHSEEVTITLPERDFTNPVARQIVAQRRHLQAEGDKGRKTALEALSQLSLRPDTFHDDTVVFLALRVAVARLRYDFETETMAELRNLLWETALRLEDGGVSLAGRDLAEAERALTEALDRNAPREELERRMAEFQAALSRFLDSLDQQAATSDPPPPRGQTRSLNRADLEAMSRNLAGMTETGARDDARRMLSELHQILDDLRQGGASASPEQTRTLNIINKLQDLATEQRRLLESRPTPPPPGASESEQTAAGEQGRVREKLGSVMQELDEATGTIPKPLGQAERAMHEAEGALRLGATTTAATAQTRALNALQQSMRTLADQLNAGAGGETNQDPLGRPRPGRGAVDSSNLHVPEQPSLQRAREILDELRRRAGQRERPRPELEYIDRLLRPF